MQLRKELSTFDLTSIVIGSIVGADIYIASALTAGLIGPFALVIWVIAGILAICLALVFAYCSFYVPLVGGPFAFVSAAFDEFYGFLAGWSLWIAEMLALPIFAIAFVQYFEYLLPLDPVQAVLLKGLFLLTLTLTNIRGVKAAGIVNDILTIAKLAPLLLLVGAGFVYFIHNPAVPAGNYIPLAPLGFSHLGTALVLIFWAYAGFEMGTFPAGEVKNAPVTVPRSIILGISVVVLFYISTNFIVYGAVRWDELSLTPTPLVLVGGVILGGAGALIMSIGALISVSGSDESGILGTARLSYAMAIDGLFPRVFSLVHPQYKTPWAALAIQCGIAFLLSLFSGIRDLISFSIFNMSFSFLLTCLALVVLRRAEEKHLPGQRLMPWIGVVICLFLLLSTTTLDKIAGAVLILAGIPLYIFFSPRVTMYDLKRLFLTEESVFVRRLQREERFLANFIRLIDRLFRYLHSVWVRKRGN